MLLRLLQTLRICLYLISSLGVCTSHSQVDPNIDWKTYQAGHFELIYDAKHQQLADEYAKKLNKISEQLKPVWPYLPEQTITILNDRTDFANGYATPIPYPHMMIFPALPNASESLADYGDWAHEILIHEYTHVLSFEQRRGVVSGLSYAFGSIVTPNILMSRWSLEGAAVEAETRYSNHGRLRSPYQDAQIRAWVRSGSWEKFDLSEYNETSIPTWPYGSRPYVFGSLMWSEMNQSYDGKLVPDFHYDMGGRAPYTTEGSLARLTGKQSREWFFNVRTQVRDRVEAQLKALEKTPFTNSSPLSAAERVDYLESSAPSISPDGLKLAFIARLDNLKKAVQIWVRPSVNESFQEKHSIRKLEGIEDIEGPSAEPKIPRLQHDDAPAGASIQRLSWFPNSESFVFDQINELSPFEEFGDLWIHNLKQKKSERLTTRLRAREPDVSPNGARIAFVQLVPGSSQLSIWDMQTQSYEVVYTPTLGSRVSHPTWLDSERILFSLRSGGEDRMMLWQRGQTPQAVLVEYPNALFAQRTPSGILFTSLRNGVPNLYRSDLALEKVTALTHSPTAVFQAHEDPFQKEVFYTEMSDSGLQIRRTSAEQTAIANPKDLPVVSRLFADRYPASNSAETVSSESAPSILSKSEDYSALDYLRPRYWLPFVYWDEVSTKTSIFTGGQDPLAKHSYSLSGLYDHKIKDWSGSVSYENRTLYPVIRLVAVDLETPVGVSTDTQSLSGGNLSVEWPFLFGKSEWSLLSGVIGTDRSLNAIRSKQWGPQLGVLYSNISQTAAQISPESGSTANLNYTAYQKGSDYSPFNLVSAGYTQYFSQWLPRRHAIMGRLQGQYIDQTVSSANFESSATAMGATSLSNIYLIRGYAPGTFLGKSLLNMNLEYRFPIRGFYKGWDVPLFFRRVSGAVVADGLFMRGFAYSPKIDVEDYVFRDGGTPFASVGAEAKLETTLGYHFPLSIWAGVYWPLNKEMGHEGSRFALGLGI